MRSLILPAAPCLVALAVPAAAQDQTAPPPPVTVGGYVRGVTDYRLRGISQSDRGVAAQGSVTVAHESGLYATLWGSTIDGNTLAARRGDAEFDISAGWKKASGGTTFDLGATYYAYLRPRPAGDRTSTNLIEPYAAVSHTLGPLNARLGIAWAPKQKALALDQGASGLLRARSNVYLSGDASASIPTTPFELTAHLGRTFGPGLPPSDPGNRDGYTDWRIGASYTHRALSLGVAYVDTDTRVQAASGHNLAGAGVIGSIGVSF